VVQEGAVVRGRDGDSSAELNAQAVAAACSQYLKWRKEDREMKHEAAIERLMSKKRLFGWLPPYTREEAEQIHKNCGLAGEYMMIEINGSFWEGKVKDLLKLARAKGSGRITVDADTFSCISGFYYIPDEEVEAL
jgi:hypothetical protein